MRYLMRDAAPLSAGQWDQIDRAVVAEAKRTLVGRRFLSLAGPLGARVQNVPLDAVADKKAAAADFWGQAELEPLGVGARRFLQVPAIYSDFAISWRDLEDEAGAGVQAAVDAALLAARREDDLVFYGDKDLGIEGLLNAKGIHKIALSDWSKGEAPLQDVAKAIETLDDRGGSGQRALVVGNDLWGKLHRLQPGTGLMEIDRVRSLVGGGLFHSPRLEKNKALLVYCDPHNMDLVVGQDLVTAYLGNDKLDHLFRVMETVVPRVKRPSAVAVLG